MARTLEFARGKDWIGRHRSFGQFMSKVVHIKWHEFPELVWRRGGPKNAVGQVHDGFVRSDQGIERRAMAVARNSASRQVAIAQELRRPRDIDSALSMLDDFG